jgi:hypothetical protein
MKTIEELEMAEREARQQYDEMIMCVIELPQLDEIELDDGEIADGEVYDMDTCLRDLKRV